MVNCGERAPASRSRAGRKRRSFPFPFAGERQPLPYWTGDILSKYFPSSARTCISFFLAELNFSKTSILSARGSIFHQTIFPSASRSLIPSVTQLDISIYFRDIFRRLPIRARTRIRLGVSTAYVIPRVSPRALIFRCSEIVLRPISFSGLRQRVEVSYAQCFNHYLTPGPSVDVPRCTNRARSTDWSRKKEKVRKKGQSY